MNYHEIKNNNMLNGEGLRVILFLSGCDHKCRGCHNPQTWDYCSGVLFDETIKQELFNKLSQDHIDGVTLSGGDPFSKMNIQEVTLLIHDIKEKFPNKTVWVYTGNTFEFIKENYYYALCNVDVLVDGKFVQELADINYEWAGSTNQRVIDVQKTLEQGEIILFKN